MQLIPVVDLRHGLVVHARGGDRKRYRPLCDTADASEPSAVVRDLLALGRFTRLYVADLDAIEGSGDNRAVLRILRHRFPRLELWVDAGFRHADAVRHFHESALGVPVLGSESLSHPELVARAARHVPDVVLSLDFKADAFLGPVGLLDTPARWPARVLVMNLDRVGSGRGPDLERLRRLRIRAPEKRLYAAGGVRDSADLERLDDLGVAGVLLASALHGGQLSASALARWEA